jgi:hypothetical protein
MDDVLGLRPVPVPHDGGPGRLGHLVTVDGPPWGRSQFPGRVGLVSRSLSLAEAANVGKD